MSTGYGRDKNKFKIVVEYMKETYVCDLGVDEKIILNKLYCMVWTELRWPKGGTVVVRRDVCRELPGRIKGGTFIDSLNDVRFLYSKYTQCEV